MNVSIVVATRNRNDNLRRCLRALTQQEYDQYEIILIDDASSDGTQEVVQEEFPRIRYLRQEANLGPASARNRGIEIAQGDLITFTDDDCVAPPDWITSHVRYYDDPAVGAVGGPQVPSEPNFFDQFDIARYADRFYSTVQRIDTLTGWEGLATSNMSVRREVLEEVGTFDETFLTGADPELSRRISRAGYVLIVDPALRVEHLKVHNLGSYLSMRFRRGCGSVLTDIKEGSLVPRRFLPLLNLPDTWRNWQSFRRLFGGEWPTFLRFWGLALLVRWVEVAGRLYYYSTVGRRYQAQRST